MDANDDFCNDLEYVEELDMGFCFVDAPSEFANEGEGEGWLTCIALDRLNLNGEPKDDFSFGMISHVRAPMMILAILLRG